ncbi:polysialyltransferase family glycosyltransferase [Pseudoalteromonas sp. MMG022]|uniref:polysialyltransferase family glycosyltransferase n=1 Tax=Pseudoalteromonas sp. MMG022 TaxID=2909978 RepID=UPI001F448401|nr:polysialyltransferase family glycosyltransferase [Pseudoalteromonas sp. MMG022]MCF6434976.1 hypothetical protein [Pseudoalteromonas sp. MMG022]
MNKKNVLVIPSHDASLVEYVRLFKRLHGELNPIFYITYHSKKLVELLNTHWHVINDVSHPLNTTNKNRWVANLLKYFFDNTALGCYLQSDLLLSRLANKAKHRVLDNAEKLTSLMVAENITDLVISSDRSSGIEAAACYAAKKLGVKIIIPAFAYSATYESSYKLRTMKIYHAKYSQVPQNIKRCAIYGDKGFYRPFESLMLHELGIHPENPWVLGGGVADSVLLDSKREKSRLVSYGGVDTKYQVTGTAAQDEVLHCYNNKASIKKTLLNNANFSIDRPILIISLPQYFEHRLMGKEEHIEIFKDLFDKLAVLNYSIFVSLHPKSDRDDYHWINECSPNIKIIDCSLTNIIAIADIFMGTYTSTMCWALMCHVECVIVDHPNLNYQDFLREFDIPVCKSNEEIIKLLTGPKQSRRCNFESIEQLGEFDGKSSVRIFQAFNNSTLR